MKRKVPPAMPCRTPLQMSCGRLTGRSDTAMPSPTPRGLDRLNNTLDRTKLLVDRLDWAVLRPRLKAMTALWTMTAMKMEMSWAELSCSPMAIPSNTEWKERAIRSMRERRAECWNSEWVAWE